MLSTLETRDYLQRNIGLWCKILYFTSAKYFLSLCISSICWRRGNRTPCVEKAVVLSGGDGWEMAGRWLGTWELHVGSHLHPPPPSVPAVAFCYLMYIRGVEIENYRTIGHPSYRPACTSYLHRRTLLYHSWMYIKTNRMVLLRNMVNQLGSCKLVSGSRVRIGSGSGSSRQKRKQKITKFHDLRSFTSKLLSRGLEFSPVAWTCFPED
jgi:hypothetical protein